MAKIYTRTGDTGETALYGGGRVRKDEVRVAAYGTVDELNAALGVAHAELERTPKVPIEIRAFVIGVQHQLFNLGAELATPTPAAHGTNLVDDSDVAWLETSIDGCEAGLEPLKVFILPGGSPAGAQLHFARCVCRRAERLIVRLAASEPVRGEVLRYINRLSDALFVVARAVNRHAGVPDTHWQQKS